VTGRERPRRADFRQVAIGLVLICIALGAIFLGTRYRSSIALLVAMFCIFIGLVILASGAGLGWFPMMGVEKWRTGTPEGAMNVRRGSFSLMDAATTFLGGSGSGFRARRGVCETQA
jgi:hypothetical protein